MPRVLKEYKVRARERIIDAAAEVVRREGLAGSTMESIAREIGVSKGALYLYFPSKAQLLVAILGRYRDEVMARLELAVEKGDVAEEIATAVENLLRDRLNPSVWAHVAADSWSDPEVREALLTDQREDREHVRQFLQRLEQRGRISPIRDPVVAADALMLVLAGAVMLSDRHGSASERRTQLVGAIRLILGEPKRSARR
jgi:AcrR family transcriptional regulator